MGEHFDQVLPSLHFLLFEFGLDVLQGDELEFFPSHQKLDHIDRELHDSVGMGDFDQFGAAGAEILDGEVEFLVDAFDL